MRRRISRRAMLGAGLGTVSAAFVAPSAARGEGGAILWGVNGHPITAYPGISFAEQMQLVCELGMTHYRINTRPDGSPNFLARYLQQARKAGVTLVPVLHPGVDMARDSVETLHDRAFALGRDMARRFRGEVRMWELSNELENFAIIKACEMRDDGTQYPCAWGPAGGVGPLEYFGPRWRRVSAVLGGLSAGVAAGDPDALRAIGTAGWGHLGAFARLAADGVPWDITVWHDYPTINEGYLAKLASYGKPIWLTEFNAGGGGGKVSDEENAALLKTRIAYYRRIAAQYRIEAAFVYELLDEPYWGSSGEGKMGLFTLVPAARGWRLGPAKLAAHAVAEAIR